MKAIGARALQTARCSCRRPLVRPRAAARLVKSDPVYAQSQIRSFRTSIPACSSDHDPNQAEDGKSSDQGGDSEPSTPTAPAKDPNDASLPAAEDNESNPEPDATQASAPSPPETLNAPTLRRYGMRRARLRGPMVLPPWFIDRHVSLYESRPIGSPETLLFPLEGEDREALLNALQERFDQAALTPDRVKTWKELMTYSSLTEPLLSGMDVGDSVSDELEEKLKVVHMTAFLQALALVHHEAVDPRHMERLRRYHENKGEDIKRSIWWFDDLPFSARWKRWLANVRSDSQPMSGALHGSPLARRGDPEYPTCMELLAAIKAELLTESPSTTETDPRRPITVLSILNRKGPSVANAILDDIATDLKADVVHLNAAMLADLLGSHFGENLHWGRGSLSMLGYAAAEMNGRLACRLDVDGDGDPESSIGVAMSPSVRSYLFSRRAMRSLAEGRLDDRKIAQVLEALTMAAHTKREENASAAATSASATDRPLIIHVHDFVEISSILEQIIRKLRMKVDQLWQRGRKIVLVGSSSSDSRTSTWMMRERLLHLGQDGSHIIPLHTSEPGDWIERRDNLHENVNNIKNMLYAMLGTSANPDFILGPRYMRYEESEALADHSDVIQILLKHVYDVQWVYRLASLMLGSQTPRPRKFRLEDVKHALQIMSSQDKHMTSLYPDIRPPYFSPLFTPGDGEKSADSGAEEFPPGGMPSVVLKSQESSKGPIKIDPYEQKLLSGLINAKDIHTTFNDIIVPPETKESLIGLTTLSLVRPDAFSYGVLKTERIPGCLLYGPPGTGKTLLAKAVAKESGANMLDVSAATINEMYVGQGEKNVRALFSLARKMAPMVIFLDEADALLGARGPNSRGRGAHREVITQFLREWDGITDMGAFIMVATNRPFELDEAVLRRLPRRILVDLPLKQERESILRVMLREETLAEDVDIAKLATETDLYSGSDLKNLCVSAAMEAVREEVRAKEKWTSGEPYVFPERRVLTRRHFEKGMCEISASISEDMESLKAIRKFDEQYGDAGRKRKGKNTMGFEVVVEKAGTEEARVRRVASGL